MKVLLTILVAFIALLSLNGQTTDGMVAYYHFNDSTANDQAGGGSNGAIVGDPQIVCGVDGFGMKFNGTSDHVLFLGIVNNHFENDDLSLGFFLNPTNDLGTQTIFSKKETCDDQNAFAVRYTPASNTLTVEMSENSTKKVTLSSQLDFDKCWQHVGIVRAGATVRLFINGQLRETASTVSRIDLSNNGVFSIAEGACVGVTDNPFGGILDEIRLYDRALSNKEAIGLYEPLIPDNIITTDTTVFLGNDIQIVTGNSCAEDFDWTPTDDLSDASIPNPLISPTQTTTYTLSFRDSIDPVLSCTAFDSIRVTVIDPADLDCEKAFMPNAFTPNEDGRNDTYGISNPYAISDLISFEIFDRWGGRVFSTDNAMEQWDGSFKGEPINPGVLLYKVIFRCNGEEIVNLGSLSIIR